MSGGKKKKSAVKRKTASKPARLTVAPLSPVRTRSKDGKFKSAKANDAPAVVAPTNPPDPSPAEPVIQVDSASSVADLERRFVDRMSQMETSFRSALSEVSMSNHARATTPRPKPPVVTDLPSTDPQAVKPVMHGRSSRSSSASSLSDSSSAESRSSSTSADSSDHEHRRRHRRRHRHHRRHSRSSSRSSRSSSRKRRGKYCTKKYLKDLKDPEKLTTYERLVLANTRMVLALYRKGKDVKGFLKHMVYIAEKAEKCMFDPAALIAYDESIKEVARDCGSKSFEKVDPAAIVKHLSYDGTLAAQNNAKSSAAMEPAAFKPGSKPAGGICLKHNFSSSGCPRGTSCFYKHICSSCHSRGHVSDACTNVDRSASKK